MRTPLQRDEKILLVTYTSWITLIGPALLAMAAIVGSFFMGFFARFGWAVALAGVLIFLINYYRWKVNIWVVTNSRVIDENGLLSHYAKESPLDKINNVSYDQSVWGRILNYGHVEIQTAAEIGATDYYNVYHPKRLKDTITLAQSDYKNIQSSSQAKQMAAAMGLNNMSSTGAGAHNIASELEKLFDLEQKGIISEDEYNRAKGKLIG